MAIALSLASLHVGGSHHSIGGRIKTALFDEPA